MTTSPTPSTVLVAGATGYLGRFLVVALHDAGYRVRALVRSRERAEEPGSYDSPSLADHVDEWVVAASPQEAAARPGLLDGVDHVVSALGVTRQKADPWDIDFLGNLALLEAAEDAHLGSFLYIGAINIETGTSGLARAKTAFIEAARRSSVPTRIVQPSGYFSDLTEFLDMARTGVAVRLGDGSTRLNPIHGSDLASHCVSVLGAGAGFDEVGGPDVLTYTGIVEIAFAALGKRPRWISLPRLAAPVATWSADRVGPRAGSLTRFFIEGMQTDAVGVKHGSTHLADYYAGLVEQAAEAKADKAARAAEEKAEKAARE